jgi:predicted nuclease with TOPRIM domain
MKSTTAKHNLDKEFNLELENSYLKNEIKKLKSELLKKQDIIENIHTTRIKVNTKNTTENTIQNYGFNISELCELNTELYNNMLQLKNKNQYLETYKQQLEENIDMLNKSVSSLSSYNTDLKCEIEKFNCVVCMDNQKDIILEPCGHLVFCNDCYNNCYNTYSNLECPICRIQVNGIIKIYN